MTRSALVIGGGVIGTTTAWYLHERGYEVTVLERREGAGLETSFANGGMLTPSQADPWNAPGTLGRLLKWLGKEDSPLLLRPGAVPGMTLWGLKFLFASRKPAFQRSATASVKLGLYSVEMLDELRDKLKLSYDERLVGTIKIFQDKTLLNEAVEIGHLLERNGLRQEVLDADAAIEREPALAPIRDKLAGAIHYPEDESGDAHKFTRALAEAAKKAGVRFLFDTTVERIRRGNNGIDLIQTNKGDYTADVYVLCAGCQSHALGKQCGLKLPIYPAKGYSITAPVGDWQNAPAIPIVDFDRKIVITPMGDRLRAAGTAEFTGYDTTLTPARSDNILRQTLDILPDYAKHVDPDKVERWAGMRPMTPDGPPIIGTSPYANLFLNTGHGPLGWTYSAGSGKLVADIISGGKPAIDHSGLSYERF